MISASEQSANVLGNQRAGTVLAHRPTLTTRTHEVRMATKPITRRRVASQHRQPFYERFWSKVDRRGPNECWNWIGGTDGKDRGQINPGRRADGTKGSPIKAPRAAWMLTYGEVPDGFVCHTCDNPLCVNPAHLFLGTANDNVQDMVAKGRHWLHGASHCPNGHEYTPESTYIRTDGNRTCKICRASRGRAYRARKRGRA